MPAWPVDPPSDGIPLAASGVAGALVDETPVGEAGDAAAPGHEGAATEPAGGTEDAGCQVWAASSQT
ncbi:hypothetical protein [Frankia sp. AiPa1]|uniref:hypothetical protein n=1 Tax=Frankia sp. AiPa1 TaxID=573492 RepID=UPI00202B123C|nr:hypothetical protein [Frankia sp. AiPa1]MCL9757762.1 hypothetical protein [Frankia sp. AiPa1]